MTKEEIIKAVWNQLPDLTVHEARKIYETTMTLIRDSLARGEKVEIRNFGRFNIKEKTTRIGRNPRTGEKAEIKERRVVTFKPSKILRNHVSNGQNINNNIADNESSD